MCSTIPDEKLAIPRGSTVLVTGANGFIGSHVCNEFLQSGFDVKGAVRDTSKSSWLAEALRSRKPKGKFTMVALPDMEIEENFHALMHGRSHPRAIPAIGLCTESGFVINHHQVFLL